MLPLRALGPADGVENHPHHDWPFATSDLYDWKMQKAKLSDNPRDLLDSSLFTHLPIWDDGQQLLQILLTTEERKRIQVEAQKLVPGANGEPTTNLDVVSESFHLSRPAWDFNMAEGKQRL